MAVFNPKKIQEMRIPTLQKTPSFPEPVDSVASDTFEPESVAETQESKTKVIRVSLKDLLDFQNHPFSRGTDEKMQELSEDILRNGLISLPTIRPAKGNEGKYEIVAGHRRRDACMMAGMEEIEAVIRDLDDEQAALMMVSSNLEQRDEILPVERGYAYKMMLDALKRQGQRTDLTSRHLVGKLETAEIIGESIGESGRQIQRYIRLTELIKPLQERVNRKHIGLVPAVALSYLSPGEQEVVEATLLSEKANISGELATALKEASQANKLSKDDKANDELITYMMMDIKEKPSKSVKMSMKRFCELLPDDMREQTLTTEEQTQILEEAMALYREKHQAMGLPLLDEAINAGKSYSEEEQDMAM